MNDASKIEHEVTLHLQELGIKLFCRTSGDQVLQYPYPKVVYKISNRLDRVNLISYFKISACGCNSDDPRYVAFIGGDNLCRLAKQFLCHVFYAQDANLAREIVHHMANGFERTLTTA